MLHFMRRPLLALLFSIALSVLALALWVAVLNASPPIASPASAPGTLAVAGSLYCSNWDFLNSTGEAVNDLHVSLKGVQTVTGVYTGTFNPFGLPDNTSGYISATDVYSLNFSGAWVNESDMVHIGFCSTTPKLRLDSGVASFEWTLTGTQVLTKPLFLGVEWSWPTRSHLQVKVVNEQPVTTTLMSMQLLNAGSGLTLDDLNATVVDQLPMVLDMLPLPQTMPPNSQQTFDAYFNDPNGLPPDHAQILSPPYLYVLETILVSEADPSDSTHLFAQALAPFLPLYLPLIAR